VSHFQFLIVEDLARSSTLSYSRPSTMMRQLEVGGLPSVVGGHVAHLADKTIAK
jgi:hypothetical protein